jgi:hypothetical protein
VIDLEAGIGWDGVGWDGMLKLAFESERLLLSSEKFDFD